jgi:hypothetical protein
VAYPGIYRAKAVSINGTKLSAFIPQVFGDVPVTVENFVGEIPIAAAMGWVSFQGGNPEFPVWHGGGIGGGGGTVTDVVWVGPEAPDDDIELWWDTDAEVPLDPRYLTQADGDTRYVNTAGDVLTGHLTLPSTDPPGTYSAVHHDWMMRWINLILGGTPSPLTLATNWEHYPGFQGGRVTKIGNLIVCEGLVRRIVGAPVFTTGTIATVPVGYRPTAQSLFGVMNSSAVSVCRLDVTPAGAITLSSVPAVSLSAGSWVNLAMTWML